jgi:hypothetical protein
LFGGDRSLADVSFAGETAAAVVGAIAFAPSFASAAKKGVKRAAEVTISPDVPVDRLVADRKGALDAQPATDLLGAPPLAKKRFDALQIGGREALITS